MSLTPAWLDELRSRTLLSALIGKSAKITRAGREWKACCPFHDEKTPSFTINDEKGFYHCLAGETVVITEQGRRPIADLAGTTATILSRAGRWINARFDDYGQQRLWAIHLSRNGVSKTIFATDGHRWFARGRKSPLLTSNLSNGHRLEAAVPPARVDWELDDAGIRHGILFGDGTEYRGGYGTINLHGAKDAELAQWFPDQTHHRHERANGEGYLRVYGGKAFAGCKQLPHPSTSEPYLLGFLAGYLAADGHVAKDGTVMLHSANPDHLEYVRDIATRLGIVTYGVTTQLRTGIDGKTSNVSRIHFVASTMHPALFLLSEARRRFAAAAKKFARLRWVVTGVEPTDRVETVYCAQVPEEHAFALDDNILTGNCFGCGAHGDAIRWMTDQRGLPFMEAVKELAAAAGMEVPAADPRAAQRAERQVHLRDVTEASAAWYRERLMADEGANARAYIQQRGLFRATVETFGIGFAPDARGRLREVLATFGDAMAVEAGMLILPPDDAPANRKEPYDRFRGRLMIPIRDARGRTIAFGGRILGAGEPKYLNSPDTPLFDKGRLLYNLDRAAPAARKAGRMFVVEGYMDVIALAQAGIEEAVAPLGTAMTEAQMELAWRQVAVPILAFDGDATGQRAAMRAALRALPLLRPGHSLAFLTLPAGKDPDDLVKTGGAAAFDALAEQAMPLVELLWRAAYATLGKGTPEERAAVRAQLMQWVETIQDRDIAAHYREAFRERLDDAFFARRNTPAPRAPFQPAQRSRNANRFAPPERPPTAALRQVGSVIDRGIIAAILGGLIRFPQRIAAHSEALAALPYADSVQYELSQALIEATFSHQGLEQDGLMAILEQRGLYNSAQAVLRADVTHFSFSRPQRDATPAEAQMRDLDRAVAALVALAEVDERCRQADRRAFEDLTEETLADQQRWHKAKRELLDDLRDFAAGAGETA